MLIDEKVAITAVDHSSDGAALDGLEQGPALISNDDDIGIASKARPKKGNGVEKPLTAGVQPLMAMKAFCATPSHLSTLPQNHHA